MCLIQQVKWIFHGMAPMHARKMTPPKCKDKRSQDNSHMNIANNASQNGNCKSSSSDMDSSDCSLCWIKSEDDDGHNSDYFFESSDSGNNIKSPCKKRSYSTCMLFGVLSS